MKKRVVAIPVFVLAAVIVAFCMLRDRLRWD